MDYYPLTFAEYDVLHSWTPTDPEIYTGTDITADQVFSYASGTVVAVGKEDLLHYCVSVQYDVFNILRYSNLKSVSVGAGDTIQNSALIGTADKFLRFEYATKQQGSSKWPVRIGTQTYWKQDPALLSDIKPVSQGIVQQTILTGSDTVRELSDGRGDG